MSQVRGYTDICNVGQLTFLSVPVIDTTGEYSVEGKRLQPFLPHHFPELKWLWKGLVLLCAAVHAYPHSGAQCHASELN